MLFARKSLDLPTPATALPGRDTPMARLGPHAVTGRAIQPPFPDGLETAVVGLGCFWGPDRHRAGARRPLLLRRGLPPAVPPQEPRRLLRPGRHRSVLSRRPGRRLTALQGMRWRSMPGPPEEPR